MTDQLAADDADATDDDADSSRSGSDAKPDATGSPDDTPTSEDADAPDADDSPTTHRPAAMTDNSARGPSPAASAATVGRGEATADVPRLPGTRDDLEFPSVTRVPTRTTTTPSSPASGSTGTVTEADDAHPVRASRWDRAPEPRDWRYYVGNLGRILITIGLLMFGFVAYQLWGTGIETARAQGKLEDQFEALIARTDSTTAPQTTVVTSAVDQPDETGFPDISVAAPIELGTVPTVQPTGADEVPVTVVPAAVAVDRDLPAIVRGEVLARLEIPRIDQVEYIVPGVSLDDLKKGSGHYPDTPLPGQLGNSAIAGHRTTYGAPFFDVDQLGAGDELIVTMLNGDRFVYLVTFVEIVGANDYWVVTNSDPNIAELTLTSCHPKYTARDRIVVHSVLDPTQSSAVGRPTFYDLEASDVEIPGDDPVISVEQDDAPTAEATAESGDEPSGEGDELDAGDSGSTDQDTGGIAVDEGGSSDAAGSPDDDPATVDGQAPADAFSRGWFDDPSAFWQVALWGVALLAIWLLMYRVAARVRRWPVGIAVGVLPFVVALYFFYQNVNRLLPPGI